MSFPAAEHRARPAPGLRAGPYERHTDGGEEQPEELGGEGQGLVHAEQGAADQRPDQPGRGGTRLEPGGRRAHPVRRHDRAHQTEGGGGVDAVEHGAGGRDQEDEGHRGVPVPHGDGQRGDGRQAAHVAQPHQPAAFDPVGHDPARQHRDQHGADGHGSHGAGLHGGARLLEDQQGQRDGTHLAAENGEEAAQPEQPEIPVGTERLGHRGLPSVVVVRLRGTGRPPWCAEAAPAQAGATAVGLGARRAWLRAVRP
ncbi:hypothetical protein SGRI78S_06756 [Streptomyces griseus subsp. griseus]